ncbi:hypothetical protein GQR58_029713 [Nymphon striatum]|nr:hypothetical protein GQR58_029713 [Nymphon striatum]
MGCMRIGVFLVICAAITISVNFVCIAAIDDSYISPLDLTSIVQLQMAIVAVMAHFWLNEKIGMYEIVCIIGLIVSVILVLQPPFIFEPSNISFQYKIFGYLEALLSTVISGFVICYISKNSQLDAYFISTIQSIAAGILTVLVGFPRMYSPTNVIEWTYTLLGAFAGSFSMIFDILSLYFEDTTVVIWWWLVVPSYLKESLLFDLLIDVDRQKCLDFETGSNRDDHDSNTKFYGFEKGWMNVSYFETGSNRDDHDSNTKFYGFEKGWMNVSAVTGTTTILTRSSTVLRKAG